MNRFDWGRLKSRWKGPGEAKTLAANVRNIGTTNRIRSTGRAGAENGIGSQCPLEYCTVPSLPSTPKPVLTNSTAPRKHIPEHPAGTTGLPVSSDAGSCTVGSHSTASEHQRTRKHSYPSLFLRKLVLGKNYPYDKQNSKWSLAPAIKYLPDTLYHKNRMSFP